MRSFQVNERFPAPGKKSDYVSGREGLIEQGEETEDFYRVARVMVLCSLPPLAVGICGDFTLVVYKLTEMRSASLGAAGVMLSIFGVLWFGYPWLRRNRAEHLVAREAQE